MDTKSQNRQIKEEEVEKLTNNFGQKKALIFWDYAGLSVPKLQQIRNSLRQNEATIEVAKNTLIKLALEKNNLELENPSLLDGPTAILAVNDELTTLKILVNELKTAGVGKLKCGFIDGKFTNNVELEYLASLPSKEVVFGQITSMMNSPAGNLVNILQSGISNLIFILNSRANIT